MSETGTGTIASTDTSITFDLEDEDAKALAHLAGKRKVRLSGQIRKGKLVVDNASFADEGQTFQGSGTAFVAVNAPFMIKAA
ncbi:hypothetical protein [Rhizobium sp. CF080]|uniref:hypothetical protein n=1 Tax=Rhizobium sp. (strain CF080) TaxID=1144310 RepID=UPI000566D476|nr:hypothetical protein [Rhizobium sp. CF080]